jgi:hypothetical protein
MAETPEQGSPLANIRKAGWLLAAVGATFLILGIAVPVAHQLDLATKTGRATGIVVDYVLTTGSEVDHVVYATGRTSIGNPVIEFGTASGLQVQFQAGKRWPGVADRIGQDVSVAYDPANPSQATINDIRDVLYPLFLCFIVGLFCLLGGTWVLTRFTTSDGSAAGLAA